MVWIYRHLRHHHANLRPHPVNAWGHEPVRVPHAQQHVARFSSEGALYYFCVCLSVCLLVCLSACVCPCMHVSANLGYCSCRFLHVCRQQLDILSVQGHTGPSWSRKIPKAFFRGRDSRQERLDLVEKHRNNTDMFDVGLTNFFFFEYDEQRFGPKHKHISFFEFFTVSAKGVLPL